MEFPENLKYTKDHEWILVGDDGIATVGITAFAASELGDIVYLDVESVDETIEKDEPFGSIEAVKTVSDLFMPITGTVVEFNTELEDNPEAINANPYEAWIIKVKDFDADQLGELMDTANYQESLPV